jgi:hypothetical protein
MAGAGDLVLHVRVVQARNLVPLPDSSSSLASDPTFDAFVLLHANPVRARSPAIMGGACLGMQPAFDFKASARVRAEGFVGVEVMRCGDVLRGKPEASLGSLVVRVRELLQPGGLDTASALDAWRPLLRDSEPAGEIRMRSQLLTWVPDPRDSLHTLPQSMQAAAASALSRAPLVDGVANVSLGPEGQRGPAMAAQHTAPAPATHLRESPASAASAPARAPAIAIAAASASIDDLRNVRAGDESLGSAPFHLAIAVVALETTPQSGLASGDVAFAILHVRSLHIATVVSDGALARGEALFFAFRGGAVEACSAEHTPVGIEVRRAAQNGQPEVVFGTCVVPAAAEMVMQDEEAFVDERYPLTRGGFLVGTLRVRSRGRARLPSDAYAGIPSAAVPLAPPPGIFVSAPLPLPQSLPPGVYNL